jgi:hypothetical protein
MYQAIVFLPLIGAIIAGIITLVGARMRPPRVLLSRAAPHHRPPPPPPLPPPPPSPPLFPPPPPPTPAV